MKTMIIAKLKNQFFKTSVEMTKYRFSYALLLASTDLPWSHFCMQQCNEKFDYVKVYVHKCSAMTKSTAVQNWGLRKNNNLTYCAS